MNLVVFSHKLLWKSAASPSGYATDGGFAFHMQAISELFDSTTLVVSVSKTANPQGEVFISGHNLKIFPLYTLKGDNLRRKVSFVPWLIRNFFTIRKLIKNADCVHTPIPGDIGTIGMVLANRLNKPLFVRHCGNWFIQKTATERYIKTFMEKNAGGRNVMLATGGASAPPSGKNLNIKWIFSSSLRDKEIMALRNRLHTFDPSRPRFIITARQEKEKGADKALMALAMLKSQNHDFTFDVVGNGGYLPALKVLAKELGIEDKVVFYGKLSHDEVIRAMQNADIFLYPTTASEGFPKVVFEAMACGLPVITNPVSVLPQLLGQGGGVLLQNDSPESILSSILPLLGNPEIYNKMQQNAFATSKDFSLENWRDTIGGYLEAAWGKLRND